MKKIRILQVVHSMPIAGAEKLVYDMIDKFSAAFEFYIVCLDQLGILGEELHQKGYNIFCLNRTQGLDFSLPKRISIFCRKNNIDIIHAHQYTPYFYSALSRFFYFAPKLIFTEHGRHYPDIVSWKRKVGNQLLRLYTNKIVAVGKFPKESIIHKERLPASKITVVYNGIDFGRLENLKPKEQVRHKLRIDKEEKIVGFVGRLHPIKNPFMLIKAFAIVDKNIANTRLIIAGDGELMEGCKSLCKELNLSNVAFLGMRRDVLDIMQLFDVIVLSSLSEATSVTLIEAMASGIPTVCTKVGGNPEITVEGVTGLLSERLDKEGLAKNIIQLLQNELMRKNFGIAAQKRAYENFSLSNMIKKYETIYKSL